MECNRDSEERLTANKEPLSEELPSPTERLILRYWRAADSEELAKMHADPRVMEFFLNDSVATKAMRHK